MLPITDANSIKSSSAGYDDGPNGVLDRVNIWFGNNAQVSHIIKKTPGSQEMNPGYP